MRKVKETAYYSIFEDVYEGKVITFRRWHNDAQGADILFTDDFARACGYSSKDDMIASTIGEQGRKAVIAKFGYLPKWVRPFEDGKVYFVGETFNLMGEA